MSAARMIPIIPISGSLVEIQDHLSALFDTLEGCDDPAVQEQIHADIDAYLAAEIKKVDNIAGYIAHCEAQQEFAAEEVKRLQERKRSWERKQERLEGYIQRIMEANGKARLEGRVSTLVLKPCPASVEVLDQKLVPQQYLRITVSEAVDKTIARVDLKNGIDVPGLRLVTDRKSVIRK